MVRVWEGGVCGEGVGRGCVVRVWGGGYVVRVWGGGCVW